MIALRYISKQNEGRSEIKKTSQGFLDSLV